MIIVLTVSTEVYAFCFFNSRQSQAGGDEAYSVFSLVLISIKLVRLTYGLGLCFLEITLFAFLLLFIIHLYLSFIRILILVSRFL